MGGERVWDLEGTDWWLARHLVVVRQGEEKEPEESWEV